MAIIVTGGAGFIGSNLVHALNSDGISDIVVVDDLSDGRKVRNLAEAQILDYLDKHELRRLVADEPQRLADVSMVVHQGAITSTTEWDARDLMDNNYGYSRDLLEFCTARSIPFIYASSASVYGRGPLMDEAPGNEHPLNPYAYSKALFDQRVRRTIASGASQVVGLRYFNVYGPREAHKGSMASVVTQFAQAVAAGRPITLFAASHGYPDGGHERDFVHVDDVVDVIRWFAGRPDISGIYNCGTGTPRSFRSLASAVTEVLGDGRIEFQPMPETLLDAYQPCTRADLQRLRSVGCDVTFRTLDTGVAETLNLEAWRS